MMIGSLVKQGKYVGGRQQHYLLHCLENKVSTNFSTSHFETYCYCCHGKGLLYDLQYIEKVDVVHHSFVLIQYILYIVLSFPLGFQNNFNQPNKESVNALSLTSEQSHF